jgi:M6 family metalloprotease-like protein
MRTKFLILLTVVLSLSLITAPSNAAVKAGAKCTKAGATATAAGKKFTCVKSGKKLVWNKGVSAKAAPKPNLNPVFKPVEPAPSPTPTPVATPTATSTPMPTPTPTRTPDWVDPLFGKPCTKIYERIPNQIFELICMPHKDTNPGSTDPTLYWAQSNLPGNHKFPSPAPKPLVANSYSNPTVSSLPINQCEIVEQSKVRNDLPTGFPRVKPRTPDRGTIKWALVPVDFVDLPGDKDFMSRMESEMKLAAEWIETVSEGKLKIEWVVAKDWITLPGVSTDYRIPFSEDITKSPEVAYFWKQAIPAVDPYFDFTGIKTVNFIVPKGQKIIPESGQGWPWDAGMKTNPTKEGIIDSFTILGAVFELPGTTYWQYWAHEFGHAIGIPHLSGNRVWRQSAALDLMGNDNGPSKELSTWLRFVQGWLDDERVYCQDKVSLKSTDVTLVPLNQSKPGIKMTVVKLSSTKALILESRRVTKFECVTESYREGVLAYIYDATLGHNQDFLVAVEPAGRPLEKTACRSPDTTDSLLRTGDQITVDGVTVEVLQHGTYDVVRIFKKD